MRSSDTVSVGLRRRPLRRGSWRKKIEDITGILPQLYLLSFFVSYPRAHWTELNQHLAHFKCQCDLKMHVQNLQYPSWKSDPKTKYFQHFSKTSRLNGNFNSNECIREETRCRQSRTALETTTHSMLQHPV